MTHFTHKPGTGSLFKNQFKSKENQPDLTGKIILSKDLKAGDELKIAAWMRGSDKGNFLSISENNYESQTNPQLTDVEDIL